MMQCSEAGIALLKRLEGCEPLPYRDPAGLWTLGVGHLLTRDELHSGKIHLPSFGVCRYGRAPWPEAWIADLLRADLRRVETALQRAVHVPLSQPQYDALVCWGYNVGTGALRTSTLLRLLNAGDYEAVPTQMRRWVYAGGQVLTGLRHRREQEIALWNSPPSAPAVAPPA